MDNHANVGVWRTGTFLDGPEVPSRLLIRSFKSKINKPFKLRFATGFEGHLSDRLSCRLSAPETKLFAASPSLEREEAAT
ncbi:unnamed protein product [Ilex paraguariensis]|uniref:Uncharacterized protein n=1 Tax=Ilex paraguariensis TaxID=185542 RepID=A0ABC8U1U2_9AQUA